MDRGRFNMLIGALLLAGALIALGYPVYHYAYDRWGVQIKCGTGYQSQLLQAAIDDQEQATNHVNQCKSALLHRRAWAIPMAGLGAVLLIAGLVTWARGGPLGSPEPTSQWSAGSAEAQMHDAAQLDRRYRSHRPTPHDTTL